MPTYTEAIKFEETAPHGTIRLILSGRFYRAYGHSAWLFINCIADYKIVRKFVKILNRNVYYVGFPVDSLFSNIGERASTKTSYGFDIQLADNELPNEEDYETWLATVQAEEASKGEFVALPLSGTDAEREVIRRLREFQLESKTMVECVVFLSELRKLLSNQ